MKSVIWLGSLPVLVAAAVVLAALHPFGNPHLVGAQPRNALLVDASMPEAAKNVLRAKCADCHSNSTEWPVYARLAPASWLVEHDVMAAREHLNLSEWAQLSEDQRESLEQEIVRQARRGAMPPVQYRLVHWNAALKGTDVAALALLAPQGPDSGAAANAGDPVRGKSVFEKRCTGCHAIDANREGPHLRGVYGRKAGSVPGFDYSDALKNSGIVWNEDTLERWLTDTDAAVPNSNMGFSVPKAQDRADIIAYLRSLQ